MKEEGCILLYPSSNHGEPTIYSVVMAQLVFVVSCAVHAKPDGYQRVLEEAA